MDADTWVHGLEQCMGRFLESNIGGYTLRSRCWTLLPRASSLLCWDKNTFVFSSFREPRPLLSSENHTLASLLQAAAHPAQHHSLFSVPDPLSYPETITFIAFRSEILVNSSKRVILILLDPSYVQVIEQATFLFCMHNGQDG